MEEETKKCPVCGVIKSLIFFNCEKPGIELHHVNYDDPLAVIPLCTEHHRMNHEISK